MPISKTGAANRRPQGLAFSLLLLALLLSDRTALARDQWSMNHGGNNPPVDPRFAPGGAYSGYVPTVGTEFWKGQLANRIPSGTVLTVILEDNLSSAQNNPGDTFAMTVEDGYFQGGKLLIPAKSKIIGSVVHAISAKRQSNGQPGTLEISLQSLVFPDGSHYPISGFVDGNPGAKHTQQPQKRNLGWNIADYGSSVKGMAMSVVSGPGYFMKKMQAGKDLQLDSGEALPIRLTQSLDINQTSTSLVTQQGPGGSPNGTVPLPYRQQIPGLIDPTGPVQYPGFAPVGQSAAPYSVPPTYMPTPNFAPQTNSGNFSDPNAGFNQPFTPRNPNDSPDPF